MLRLVAYNDGWQTRVTEVGTLARVAYKQDLRVTHMPRF